MRIGPERRDERALRRAVARAAASMLAVSLILSLTLSLALSLAACATPPHSDTGASSVRHVQPKEIQGARGRYRIVRTPSGDTVSLQEAARDLSSADVVFLGELHDSAEGHAAQLAITMELAALRGSVAISMEMLERDAQSRVDLYLSGAISAASFQKGTRLWPNYREHYGPAVEFAKANGFRVIAANVYRPIASRVARRGLTAGLGDAWAARSVDVSEGEYKRRFGAIMGSGAEHSPHMLDPDDAFASQCIKDDTMAESIARAMDGRGSGEALVVHWNGRFHSDFGLGTVERLRSRRPDLNLAVVSMIAVDSMDTRLTGEDLDRGHFVVLVPE